MFGLKQNIHVWSESTVAHQDRNMALLMLVHSEVWFICSSL